MCVCLCLCLCILTMHTQNACKFCVCLCVHICMHICVYTCMHAYYVCLSVSVCVCVYVCMCVHACILVCGGSLTYAGKVIERDVRKQQSGSMPTDEIGTSSTIGHWCIAPNTVSIVGLMRLHSLSSTSGNALSNSAPFFFFGEL